MEEKIKRHKSSVLTGRANYPWVAEKLAELKVETVVDLG